MLDLLVLGCLIHFTQNVMIAISDKTPPFRCEVKSFVSFESVNVLPSVMCLTPPWLNHFVFIIVGLLITPSLLRTSIFYQIKIT